MKKLKKIPKLRFKKFQISRIQNLERIVGGYHISTHTDTQYLSTHTDTQ